MFTLSSFSPDVLSLGSNFSTELNKTQTLFFSAPLNMPLRCRRPERSREPAAKHWVASAALQIRIMLHRLQDEKKHTHESPKRCSRNKKTRKAVKSQKLSLRSRVNTAALCVCWMRRLRVHQQICLFVCTTHTQFTRSETFDSQDSPDFKLRLLENIIIEANLKM